MTLFEVLVEGASDVAAVREVLRRRFKSSSLAQRVGKYHLYFGHREHYQCLAFVVAEIDFVGIDVHLNNRPSITNPHEVL